MTGSDRADRIRAWMGGRADLLPPGSVVLTPDEAEQVRKELEATLSTAPTRYTGAWVRKRYEALALLGSRPPEPCVHHGRSDPPVADNVKKGEQ